MIEAERPDDPDAVELLAHHWSEADDAAKALPYLSDAALRSGPIFAGPQTARYVSAAQDLAARHGLAVDHVTRARWHIALAEAARSVERSSSTVRSSPRRSSCSTWPFPRRSVGGFA